MPPSGVLFIATSTPRTLRTLTSPPSTSPFPLYTRHRDHSFRKTAYYPPKCKRASLPPQFLLPPPQQPPSRPIRTPRGATHPIGQTRQCGCGGPPRPQWGLSARRRAKMIHREYYSRRLLRRPRSTSRSGGWDFRGGASPLPFLFGGAAARCFPHRHRREEGEGMTQKGRIPLPIKSARPSKNQRMLRIRGRGCRHQRCPWSSHLRHC
mmetsp:Transcript_4742/g.13400  ORF Transcript_4742/g.13400 Transcript_4742/m.13400 type:complete len:208 (+) Transcript_4742:333-956(+)